MLDFFNKLAEEFVLPLENPILVFSLVLFIILLSPIVLKRFSIPGIIGLIIAGVIMDLRIQYGEKRVNRTIFNIRTIVYYVYSRT